MEGKRVENVKHFKKIGKNNMEKLKTKNHEASRI
jgi:hypothetical protein